jgi:hypothetical protein
LLFFSSVFTEIGNAKKPNPSIAAATPLRAGFHAAIGMEGIVFGTIVYHHYHRIEHRTSHKHLSPGSMFPVSPEGIAIIIDLNMEMLFPLVMSSSAAVVDQKQSSIQYQPAPPEKTNAMNSASHIPLSSDATITTTSCSHVHTSRRLFSSRSFSPQQRQSHPHPLLFV